MKFSSLVEFCVVKFEIILLFLGTKILNVYVFGYAKPQKCFYNFSFPILLQDVVVGPENKTVVSGDNFLRVKVVGDYTGYTSIPSFEENYLVTPRKVHHQIMIVILTLSIYL